MLPWAMVLLLALACQSEPPDRSPVEHELCQEDLPETRCPDPSQVRDDCYGTFRSNRQRDCDGYTVFSCSIDWAGTRWVCQDDALLCTWSYTDSVEFCDDTSMSITSGTCPELPEGCF